jgi:hypothetical protein
VIRAGHKTAPDKLKLPGGSAQQYGKAASVCLCDGVDVFESSLFSHVGEREACYHTAELTDGWEKIRKWQKY